MLSIALLYSLMSLDECLTASCQRPILQMGNPRLRQRARQVLDPQDPEIQRLVDDLLITVKRSNGVGIAAPQVGQSWRVVIVASHPNVRYPNAPTMSPMALINPRLVAHSEESVKGWEGCLSVPGIRGQLLRYREIEVEYSDCQGRVLRQIWTDFVARIFQHEIDHLDGKVFLDRVESPDDLITEQEQQSRAISSP